MQMFNGLASDDKIVKFIGLETGFLLLFALFKVKLCIYFNALLLLICLSLMKISLGSKWTGE